jgi:predicted phage terminase large subunit-like protein
MRPIINHAGQLEEHSSWRHYVRGLQQLTVLEAPSSVLHKYMHESARYCFLAFADLMKGGALKVADFHEIIASGFEDLANKRYHNLIVSCPPRSGKSMLASMFVAWLLGKDQETAHVIASYGLSLSNKFHKEVIGMLKTPVFKKIFPEWKGFARDSKFEMLSGGFILPTSVGGVLTGHTAGSLNIISEGVGAMVIDDPLKSSASAKAFESLQTWWQEEASTRKTNNYCRLIIATRFHANDLHGQVLESDGSYDEEENPEGWRWINIAGLCEDPVNDPLGRQIGESHWPDNPTFSIDMLNVQKKTMGSSKFSALYQGSPTAAEGQIVKASWIVRVEEDKCPPLDVVWLGVDCAFSEEKTADDTAVCVAGISTRDPRTVYIREIIKGRWGFPDLISSIKQLHSFYKPKVICIEKAASGQSLIQVLRRETKIPIEEMKPLRSKTVRLEAVCPFMENDRVKIVEGLWVDGFIKELTGFPFVKHDDSVDAFVWSLTYYAMKLDAIDRGVHDAIIQSRRWNKETRRPSIDGSELPRGRVSRNLPSLNLYSNLDSDSGLYGPGSFSRSRPNRSGSGLDFTL